MVQDTDIIFEAIYENSRVLCITIPSPLYTTGGRRRSGSFGRDEGALSWLGSVTDEAARAFEEYGRREEEKKEGQLDRCF